MFQLLGIEKLSDIYLLAVLNMILMGDGSSNILHENSLTQYTGNYEQGDRKDEPFPATVFLLNPPYSAPGKGLNFAEKAMSRMSKGYAAILIQENAGSGSGGQFAKRILKHSTLLASVHMPDIFIGKSAVQTAIYVFEVGKPHDKKSPVKFIDFTNDGYARLHRKKSSQDANLRDVNQAKERYTELVDVVHYGRTSLNLIGADNYVEATIGLEGNDWTYAQHREIDLIAKVEDFESAVNEYLGWKLSAILRGELDSIFPQRLLTDVTESAIEANALNREQDKSTGWGLLRASDLFEIKKGKRLEKRSMLPGDIAFIGATSSNHGYTARVGNTKNVFGPNVITVSYNGSVGEAFYQEESFWASDDVNVWVPKFEIDPEIASYFVAVIRRHGKKYAYSSKWTLEMMKAEELTLPIKSSSGKKVKCGMSDVDFDHMKYFIRAIEKRAVKRLFGK